MDIMRMFSQVNTLLSIAEQCTNVLNQSFGIEVSSINKIIRAASQITAGAQQLTNGIEDIANGNASGINQMVLGVNQTINGSKLAIDGLSNIIGKSTAKNSLLVQELEKRGISAIGIYSREEFCDRIKENLEDIKQENWEKRPTPKLRKGSQLQDIKTKFQDAYVSGGERILRRG